MRPNARPFATWPLLVCLSAAMLALAPRPARAQSPGAGALTGTIGVQLRDGSLYRGKLVEEVPGDHITLKLATGEIRSFAWADVVQQTTTPSSPDAPVSAPPPPPAIPPPAPVPPPPSGPVVTMHSNDPSAALCLSTTRPFTWTGTYRVHTREIQSWQPVCTAPCGKQVVPGTYNICGSSIWDSDPFTLSPGGAVQINVTAAPSGSTMGGILVITVGVGALIAGIPLLAIGLNHAPLENPFFTVPNQAEVAGGSVALVAGVGAIVGASFLFTLRTHVTINGQQVALNIPGTQLALAADGLHF